MQVPKKMFDEYALLDYAGRRTLVEALMSEPDQVDEIFCIEALQSETAPLIQWLLIKLIGTNQVASAIPLLLGFLKRPDVRFVTAMGGSTALHAIVAWSFGEIGRVGIQSLLEHASDERMQVRKGVVDSLGEIGVPTPTVLETLSYSLMYDCSEVALWAALSLAKMEDASLPYLRQAVLSKDKFRVGCALDALVKIGSSGSKAVLDEVLMHSDTEMREFYTKILEQNR